MRISKEYDIRKNEILDKALKLFEKNGYNKTTINHILREVDIAKGTFYYYFKSKEEVMDAIIERYMKIGLERAMEIKERKDWNPHEKLMKVILSQRMSDQDNGMIEELHNPENALMHQKSLALIVTCLTPILTDIVNEGNEKGVFHALYPSQIMQIFLVASTTLTDEGIFQFTGEEQFLIIQALGYSLEKLLGAEKGSFDFALSAILEGSKISESKI